MLVYCGETANSYWPYKTILTVEVHGGAGGGNVARSIVKAHGIVSPAGDEAGGQ